MVRVPRVHKGFRAGIASVWMASESEERKRERERDREREREKEREERIVLNKRSLRKAPLYQCRNFAEGHDMEVFHCFIQTQSAESTPCTSAKISLGDVIFYEKIIFFSLWVFLLYF